MKVMEEEEVESWYEDEKQKLLDAYLEQLEKGANRETEEQNYTKKFELLNAQYLGLIEKALARKGKKTPMEKFKAKMNEKLQLAMEKVMRR
jgi:hypothetical protein